MMKYLNQTAASVYMGLCRESLYIGLIGIDTFLTRIGALRQMCDPESQIWHYANSLLNSEDWGEDVLWHYEDESDNKGGEEIHPDDSLGETRFEDPEIFLFMPTSSTGLQDWEFHKGDPDPQPSVPHGHRYIKDMQKLDPYLGYVSSKGKEINRVSRESIVKLWNLKKFRDFALEAIEHFMQQNKSWAGWRVLNPRKIPRRRQY
jgi:hypothetical protein